MGATLDEIIDSLQKGQSKRVTELVKMALEEGISSRRILEDGFLKGMEQLSLQFDEEEVGIPRILSVTRALDKGVEALHRYMGHRDVKEIGTAVLGTVNGELHDIGKNLVKLMMESRNIQVIDLGVNISPAKFVNEVAASKAKILILNGADDPFVKREQYDALKKDFDAAKAEYRIIEYPGAVHAFTNPEATELGKKFNLPLRYDAKADQESKAEAAKLFAANLQK